MKVHLIRKETIETFCEQNARCRPSFRDWLSKIKYADWQAPEDIKATFNSADLLGNGSNRVVFDIGGNHFRMIGKYWFGTSKLHLYIKWIGTHDDYSRLCKKGLQYTIDNF